ncbi:MAG TPA: hypothetical protein VGX92_22535 [Pyrinomonadaceae bacterium]|nr:hypothetical protein [Pyrinomonadaceae bacterium]
MASICTVPYFTVTLGVGGPAPTTNKPSSVVETPTYNTRLVPVLVIG